MGDRTALERVAAMYGVTDWKQSDWLAARQAEEEATMSGVATGWISPEKAAAMAPNLSAYDRETLRLLTMRPVRASTPADDDLGELDDDVAALWPPTTPQEAERRHRQAIAAAARRISDPDDFSALYPPGEWAEEDG